MPITNPDVIENIEFIVDLIKGQLALGKNLEDVRRSFRRQFDDSQIDAAIQHLKKDTLKASDDSSVLSESHAYEGWYPGADISPTSHWSLLRSVLRTKTSPWSDDMLRSLDFSSTSVVAQLAPPRSESSYRVKGLVLGYIQSGKTANFSAVIAKAIDAGYRLVIVLSGLHNNLRLQTQERLSEELVRPNESACTTLTSVDAKGDFEKRQKVTANRALGTKDGFTLVVLKKNTYVLRNFISWLSEATQDVIQSCPTLIIDDESDQGSVNTKKPEEEPSAINEKIRAICEKFRVASYVGYTATPFANVLIDASVGSDLFPRDFIVSLEKPPTYFGPEELFGRDAVNGLPPEPGIPIIRNVPEHESSTVAPTKKAALQSRSDSELLVPSLIEAIDSFILASAARASRGQWKQHATMLLHTSHLIDYQQRMKKVLDDYLFELKANIDENVPGLKDRLETLWINDFVKVSNLFTGAPIPSFDNVFKDVLKLIPKIELILENSSSEERLSFRGSDPLKAIVIGGNTLSRGLTLEGLTTSYFVRNSKGYDTLLQMGRWFGFRPGYVDLTRIYVTPELKSKFFHLAIVEQEVRDEIKIMAANQERPIDVGLRIRKHPSMSVTSSYKMRNAREAGLTYSGTKLQARYVQFANKKLLAANSKAVDQLVQELEKHGIQAGKSGFKDYEHSILFRKCQPEFILRFIERYNFSPANTKFSSQSLISYLTDQTAQGELDDWSVAIIGIKSGKEVLIADKYKVNASERSVIKESYASEFEDSVQLRALTPPDDELIDLQDLFKPNIKTISEAFPRKTESAQESVLARTQIRPSDRGLLLIYPINWHPDMTDEEFERLRAEPSITEPLRAAGPVFGVTIVFPRAKSAKSQFKYITNKSI